jgi:sugar phosphate isomerase/epimerase
MAVALLDRLAIQSWCFRGFRTNEEVIDALKACGVSNVELCVKHVAPQDEERPEKLQAVIDLYRDRGIAITSYGQYVFDKDEAAARRVVAFARMAGFDALTADYRPGGLEVAERLAAEYDVKIALHNHGRRHRHGASWVIEEILENSSPNIGLCLDTAWAIDSGEDPVEMARRFADRLFGVHVKDFIFDRAGKSEDVVVGQGNLDLPALLDTLREIGFAGYFTLEYEGDVDNPLPATKQCVEAIRAALK